jgi:hypothetical protein
MWTMSSNFAGYRLFVLDPDAYSSLDGGTPTIRGRRRAMLHDARLGCILALALGPVVRAKTVSTAWKP